MYDLWCTWYDVSLSDVCEGLPDYCAEHGCNCDDCIYVDEIYSDDDIE